MLEKPRKRWKTTSSLPGLLEQHLIWYPLMELPDIYKLLYQGMMGPEHLVSSPDEFSHRLAFEFDPLVPDPLQPLTEPVRPDLTLLRLNLRAYKVGGMQLDQLIPCLLETARTTAGSIDELKAAWHAFSLLCQRGHFSNFDLADVLKFSSWLEEQGFPAVHHSETYRLSYKPAYRLISHRFIHALGLDRVA
jgi:hypothetical protein